MLIGNITTPAILIGLKDCHACLSAKTFLDDHDISYLYCDLNDLPKLLQQEIVKCKRKNEIKNINAPILIYNNQLYSSFEEDEYSSIFKGEGV